MVNPEFIEKCNTCLVNSYKNPDFLQLTSYDQSLYLFTNIYNCNPILFQLEQLKGSNIIKILKFANYPFCDYLIDESKSISNIIDEFADEMCFIDNTYIFHKNFLLSLNGYLLLTDTDCFERIKKCLVPYDEVRTFGYVSANSSGFNVKMMPISDMTTEENFLDNYNDDFPWGKIKEFCESDKSGIAILHGIAGTGKSTAIRHLISTSDCKFYWLDQSMLGNINNTDFINFLIDHKQATFIMEDCEYLLHSREQGGNGLISSLLNLSDGILGDSLHIKFLCTFNADLRQIDKALLRKGRLKIKYELKELSVDKTNILLQRLGHEPQTKALPLCEIYNYDVDNGNKVKTSKIGF